MEIMAITMCDSAWLCINYFDKSDREGTSVTSHAAPSMVILNEQLQTVVRTLNVILNLFPSY